MKRLLFLLSLLLMPTLVKAQFNDNYNPYLTAALTAEAIDSKQLDNIRFDPKVLMQNPDAWETYQTYLDQIEQLNKKNKTYNVLMYTGLGVMAVSLIPMFMGESYAVGDPRYDKTFAWGIGLCGAGAVVGTIGLIGSVVQSDKIKGKKKDFIYYLKTSNNGVGIVTLF